MKRTMNYDRWLIQGERGMTLLEIMIVLAIIALVMGVLVGPKIMERFAKSKNDVAMMEAKKFAFDAYVNWDADNRGKSCPDGIQDLLHYMNKKDANDPWGNEYRLYCGGNVPAGISARIAIQSAGANGKFDDEDDIRSWD